MTPQDEHGHIERILGMAAADARYLAWLRRDREQALAAAGLQLSAAERALLGAVPDDRIARLVEPLRADLGEVERRAFLAHAGTALLCLAGATGCRSTNAGDPPPRIEQEQPVASRPTTPDAGPQAARPPDAAATATSRPDAAATATSRPDAAAVATSRPAAGSDGLGTTQFGGWGGFGQGGTGIRPDRPGIGRNGRSIAVTLQQVKVVQGGGPDEQAIARRVVRRYVGDFKHAYEVALARSPALKGEVTLRFTVGLDGVVTGPAVARASLIDAELSKALLAVLSRIQFPEPPGPKVLVVEVILSFASGTTERGPGPQPER